MILVNRDDSPRFNGRTASSSVWSLRQSGETFSLIHSTFKCRRIILSASYFFSWNLSLCYVLVRCSWDWWFITQKVKAYHKICHSLNLQWNWRALQFLQLYGGAKKYKCGGGRNWFLMLSAILYPLPLYETVDESILVFQQWWRWEWHWKWRGQWQGRWRLR